ncbi:MAG TPA: HEAT repeat domain-containing protein, partial [Desulfobulbaceae bacterium]|nr:HEAT repeat domain-containing protein [Desulfobulbaceae bacterium]
GPASRLADTVSFSLAAVPWNASVVLVGRWLQHDIPGSRKKDVVRRALTPRVFEPLAQALEGDDFVASAAADALGKLGDARAVGPLVRALAHDSRGVRISASVALARFGDTAIGSLLQALTDRNGAIRAGAASALEQMPWQPSTPEEDAAYSVAGGKWDRVIALGQAAEGAVTALLKDPDLDTRLLAVGCLEIIGGSKRWSGWFRPAAKDDGDTDQNRLGA